MNTNISGWATGSRLALVAVLALSALVSVSVLFASSAEARGHRDHDWGCSDPASELVCGENQHVEHVMTDPGVEAVEEVFHYEDVVTLVPDTRERVRWGVHYPWDATFYKDSNCTQVARNAWGRDYVLVSHEPVVESVKVVDVEAVEAIDPTYEDQCVCDEGYEPAEGSEVLQCVLIEQPLPTCDEDEELVDGVCVTVTPPATTCGEGEELVDNVCVPVDSGDPEPQPEITQRGGGGVCLNCGDDEPEVESDATDESAASEEESAGELEEEGEVLGATCTPLLTAFMREGRDNPTDEVMKLQAFLNAELGEDAPVTGVFDRDTTRRVEQFQVKYWQDVLAPWVPFGLPSAQTPTGYVYKTTLWKINSLACPALTQPQPVLE